MIVIWFNRYFLYILLAIATAFGYIWLSQYKSKLRIGDGMALLLAIIHTLIGLVCVRIFAFLEGAPGGQSLFGGIFFMPVFYFLYARLTKRSVAQVFDAFAMLMVFTLFCARLNCFKGGCCLGACIPGTENTRWPTRELESLFYLVLLVWLGKKAGKSQYLGKLYPMFMLSYGCFRFIEEWFRETDHPVAFFHLAHIWALLSIAAGVWFCKYVSMKNKTESKNRKPGKSGAVKKEETK